MEFASPLAQSPDAARPGVNFGERPAVGAVCLDIDDTLVDFTSAGRRALAAMIGRDDMWGTWEFMTEHHVALVVADELEYAYMHRQRTRSFLAEIGVDVSDEDAARFERQRAALSQCSWGLYDDVLPCLEWLHTAGIAMAAVTNASGAHQRKKLEVLGLNRFFDHVAIAGEVGAAKPEPLLFHSACAALECHPTEAVHVGDKFHADALGARHAGMAGVWLDRHADGDNPGDETCEHTGGDAGEDVFVISALHELPELLVSEFGRLGVPTPR